MPATDLDVKTECVTHNAKVKGYAVKSCLESGARVLWGRCREVIVFVFGREISGIVVGDWHRCR